MTLSCKGGLSDQSAAQNQKQFMTHEELFDNAKKAIQAVFNDSVSAAARRASLEELSLEIDEHLEAIEEEFTTAEDE